MFKTMLSNATVSNLNSSNSVSDKYIGYIRPAMMALPELNHGKTKRGTFAVLGYEELNNFSLLFRFADISTDDNKELYALAQSGAGLEIMTKGKGMKNNNQIVKDSTEALELLLSQGFYSIVNCSSSPNSILGGKKTIYSDIFTLFGSPYRVKGGIVAYSTHSLNKMLAKLNTSYANVASVNGDNYTSAKGQIDSFLEANSEAQELVNDVESKLLSAETKEEMKELATTDFHLARTTIAKEVAKTIASFPFNGKANKGSVSIF